MKSFQWKLPHGTIGLNDYNDSINGGRDFYLELSFSVMTDVTTIFIEPISFYAIFIIVMLIIIKLLFHYLY